MGAAWPLILGSLLQPLYVLLPPAHTDTLYPLGRCSWPPCDKKKISHSLLLPLSPLGGKGESPEQTPRLQGGEGRGRSTELGAGQSCFCLCPSAWH